MHGSTGEVEKLEGVVQVAKCALEKENIRIVVQVIHKYSGQQLKWCAAFTICSYKGLFTNYVISKLTSVVLQIMTQHDAMYLVGSLIMKND